MARFTSNPSRFDPYKNFKFRIKWDGRYVAGVSKVSSLKRSTEPVAARSGAKRSSARKLPGLRKLGAVTLKRGITHDKEFESWANSVNDRRRDIIIDVFDEAGKRATSYKLHGCWVSELEALPDIDANANAVAIETMKLENEGWEEIDITKRAPSAS